MIEVVCALIQDDAGRFLLAKRAMGKTLGGFWEFPGGKLEAGETPADALSRELREELLVEIDVLELMDSVEHHYEKFSISLIPCRAKILNGVPTPTEHSDLGWFQIQEIDVDTLAPADVPILRQLVKL